MQQLITIKLMSVVVVFACECVAGAEYLGPRLRLPMSPGGSALLTVETGGHVYPPVCPRQDNGVCWDTNHQGDGFYSLDFDDRFLHDHDVSMAPGIVTYADCGWNGGYGCLVKIFHGGGYETRAGHHENGSFQVSVGDYVSRGRINANIGTTGDSTGTHLHAQLVHDGDGRQTNSLLNGVKIQNLDMTAYRAGAYYPTLASTPFFVQSKLPLIESFLLWISGI